MTKHPFVLRRATEDAGVVKGYGRRYKLPVTGGVSGDFEMLAAGDIKYPCGRSGDGNEWPDSLAGDTNYPFDPVA